MPSMHVHDCCPSAFQFPDPNHILAISSPFSIVLYLMKPYSREYRALRKNFLILANIEAHLDSLGNNGKKTLNKLVYRMLYILILSAYQIFS
jgi:hypothetical protein